MYNEEEIEDSLEFCREAKQYYSDSLATEKVQEEAINQQVASSVLELPEDQAFSPARKKRGWKRPTSESVGLRILNNVLLLAGCILLAYLIASVVTRYVAHQTQVEGESMEPTLSNGDSIIIQKVSYYLGSPKRYDVVVFPVTGVDTAGNTVDTYYVKRVIGLPNETVQIVQGKVYIDGLLLADDKYCLSEIQDSGNADRPITLKEDEYFVLGDNRNMSTDSRSGHVGMIHRKDIAGKVLMRIWPFSHFGALQS